MRQHREEKEETDRLIRDMEGGWGEEGGIRLGLREGNWGRGQVWTNNRERD